MSSVPDTEAKWLIWGYALHSRRRSGGMHAIAGFDYQRAYAILKIAEMLREGSDIAAVRYEGAQDVDVLFNDGRVEFVQLKSDADETYGPGRLGEIITGFALDLNDSADPMRTSFRLVVRAWPGSAALQRLASKEPTKDDLRRYADAVCAVPDLAKLGKKACSELVKQVISRLQIEAGQGLHDNNPAFCALAENTLRSAGFADQTLDHVTNLLLRKLTPRKPIDRKLAESWTQSFKRRDSVIFMAPVVPAHFVERKALVDEAVSKLIDGFPVVLTGMGGSGKTTIAAALAVDERIRKAFPGGILWVALGQRPDIAAHLHALLTVLERPIPATVDLNVLHSALREAVAKRSVLMVLDDVWEPAAARGFQQHPGCGMLVTARAPQAASAWDVEPIDVGALEPEEALALVEHSLGPLESGERREQAHAFCKRVRHLALAVRLGALLVRGGRTFDRLRADLDVEERRLSALDLDWRDDRSTIEGNRRDISLEACLGLSVAALGEELRMHFYRLAVLPEDVVIDPETAATAFHIEDPLDARDILFDLSARGLLVPASSRTFALFRMHDLVLEYARGAFGPRREALAAVPAHLPGDLAGLHFAFLQGALAGGRGGSWQDISPTDHFDNYLSWHLIMAGRGEDLASLLREEASGRAAWFARQRRSQNMSGFLRDVTRCFGQAAKVAAHGDGGTGAIEAAIVAAVAGASAVARVARAPVSLIPRLVETGQLTVEDALTQAQLCQGMQRALHLIGLLPFLSGTQAAETKSELFALMVADGPFALAGDELTIRMLLPMLTAAERSALVAMTDSLPAEVQASLIIEAAVFEPATSASWVDSFLARRTSDGTDPTLGGALTLLTAAGFETGFDFGGLQTLLSGSRPTQKVAHALLAIADPEITGGLLDSSNAGTIDLILDSWFERNFIPDPSLFERALAAVERLAADGAQARLLARLAAVPIDCAARRRCAIVAEQSLSMLQEGDWRRFDGFAWLIGGVEKGRRHEIEALALRAGKAATYMCVGIARLRKIAALLSPGGIELAADLLEDASGNDRHMFLPALLEHAPPDLIGRISQAIYAEAARSGQVGDLTPCIDRIPMELLPAIAQAVDHVVPTADLICALVALGGPDVPTIVKTWLSATWAGLPAAERVRIASLDPGLIGVCGGPAAVLEDIFRTLGVLPEERPGVGSSPVQEAKRLIAALPHELVADSVRAKDFPPSALASYRLIDLVEVLGPYLPQKRLQGIRELSSQLDPTRAALLLSEIALLLPEQRRDLCRESIDILLRANSRSDAAQWLARFGTRLDTDQAQRLLALREPGSLQREAMTLELASYPLLGENEGKSIAAALARQPIVAPGFIRRLDRTLYPPEMHLLFELCACQWDSQLLQPRPEGRSILTDAKMMLRAEPETIELVLRNADCGPADIARFCAYTLTTAYPVGLGAVYKVLGRLAPAIVEQFGAMESARLAQILGATSKLYSN